MKDFKGPISFSSATKAPCDLEMRLRNNNHLFTFSTFCARFWEPGILVCVTERTEIPNIFANSHENNFRSNLTQPRSIYAQRLHFNLVLRVRPDALAVLVEEPRQRAHCQRHESQQGVAPPQPKGRIQATACERKQGSDQRSHGRRRSSGAGLVVRVCVDEVRRNAHLIYKSAVPQILSSSQLSIFARTKQHLRKERSGQSR